MQNFTLFYVKPTHVDIGDEIFEFLQARLQEDRILSRKLSQTTRDFWHEFYIDILERDSRGFWRMARDYPKINNGLIDVALIEGIGVTQRVKNIVGPTLYKENPNTIRGVFGQRTGGYKLPDTIVHAPKPEEVSEQLDILVKYDLI
jgi:nucleoside diphosphate kinase